MDVNVGKVVVLGDVGAKNGLNFVALDVTVLIAQTTS